jgi:AcrR family transcriptional regulator
MSAMPRVSEEYRAERRDEIAAAALRAFRRKGFVATSMADIITESGMSAGAIYGYYDSKMAIVHDVAGRIVGGRISDVEHLAERDPLPPPSDLVGVLLRGMLREVGSTGILVQMWGEAVTDPRILEFAAEVLTRLQGVFARYVARWHERTHDLDPAAAAALGVEQAPLFLAACQGFIIQSALLDDVDLETYLDRVTRHLPR